MVGQSRSGFFVAFFGLNQPALGLQNGFIARGEQVSGVGEAGWVTGEHTGIAGFALKGALAHVQRSSDVPSGTGELSRVKQGWRPFLQGAAWWRPDGAPACTPPQNGGVRPPPCGSAGDGE